MKIHFKVSLPSLPSIITKLSIQQSNGDDKNSKRFNNIEIPFILISPSQSDPSCRQFQHLYIAEGTRNKQRMAAKSSWNFSEGLGEVLLPRIHINLDVFRFHVGREKSLNKGHTLNWNDFDEKTNQMLHFP